MGESISKLLQYTNDTINRTSLKLTHLIRYIGESLNTTIISLNVYRYVDIDSTYRDRTQYPLTSNFVIPYTNASAGSTANMAADPVAISYPYVSGNTQAGSTVNKLVLALDSSSIDNFYIGNVISIQNQSSFIIAYTGSTQTASISQNLSVAPGINVSYVIRKAIPILYGTNAILQAGSTQLILNFPITASTVDNYYAGMYILFTSGTNTGEVRLINSYNGSTQQATLSLPLVNIPGTDSFEIDDFSYDNQVSFRYTGSRTTSQPCCYAVQLLQLSIPQLTLTVGYGGTVMDYPYLYVHFYNETLSSSGITIYGNNPNAGKATFRVAMTNTITNKQFFIFSLINLLAYSPLKFSPTDSIRFRVTLPNGKDLAFVTEDNFSPVSPNPLVQISALFSIKRLITNSKL